MDLAAAVAAIGDEIPKRFQGNGFGAVVLVNDGSALYLKSAELCAVWPTALACVPAPMP